MQFPSSSESCSHLFCLLYSDWNLFITYSINPFYFLCIQMSQLSPYITFPSSVKVLRSSYAEFHLFLPHFQIYMLQNSLSFLLNSSLARQFLLQFPFWISSPLLEYFSIIRKLQLVFPLPLR